MFYGKTNPTEQEFSKMKIKRFGSVIELIASKEQEYRRLHADVWSSILERLKRSHIQNYSVFIQSIENKKYLFSYFEYVGYDYESDMKEIADDPITKKWWTLTDACQRKLPECQPGEQWNQMEMVFLME